MIEYDNSNPFKTFCSFGLAVEVKDIILRFKNDAIKFTGRYHINDNALIFEIEYDSTCNHFWEIDLSTLEDDYPKFKCLCCCKTKRGKIPILDPKILGEGE